MCPTSVAAFRFPRLGWKHGSTVRMAASMAELLSPWESLVQMKSEIQRFIWNGFCYQRSICLAVQAVKSTEKITLANLSLQCPLSESTGHSSTYLPQLQGRNPPSAPAWVIPEEMDTLPVCRKDTDSGKHWNEENIRQTPQTQQQL